MRRGSSPGARRIRIGSQRGRMAGLALWCSPHPNGRCWVGRSLSPLCIAHRCCRDPRRRRSSSALRCGWPGGARATEGGKRAGTAAREQENKGHEGALDTHARGWQQKARDRCDGTPKSEVWEEDTHGKAKSWSTIKVSNSTCIRLCVSHAEDSHLNSERSATARAVRAERSTAIVRGSVVRPFAASLSPIVRCAWPVCARSRRHLTTVPSRSLCRVDRAQRAGSRTTAHTYFSARRSLFKHSRLRGAAAAANARPRSFRWGSSTHTPPRDRGGLATTNHSGWRGGGTHTEWTGRAWTAHAQTTTA